MGPTFTEGGIVQHLAKLRNLMITAGIPVPPSVKRGMVTKSPSKVYGSAANPRVKLEPIAPLFPDGTSASRIKQEEDTEQPASIYDRAKRASNKLKEVTSNEMDEGDLVEVETTRKEHAKSTGNWKGKGKGKSKSRRNDMSDDEDDELPELYDSGSEYGSPKKKRRTSGKPKRTLSSQAHGNGPLVVAELHAMPAGETVEDTTADGSVTLKVEEEDDSGPATRTRGVKRDYSQVDAASPEEAETEDEAKEPISATTGQAAEYVDRDGAVTGIADDGYAQEGVEAIYDNTPSDADTDIINSGNGAAVVDAEVRDNLQGPLQVVDTPYGQITVDTQMAVSRLASYFC
jgi:hypothetical protein